MRCVHGSEQLVFRAAPYSALLLEPEIFHRVGPTSYTTCRVVRIAAKSPQRACCFRVSEVHPLMRHTQDRGFFPIFQFSETTHRPFFGHSSRMPDSSAH